MEQSRRSVTGADVVSKAELKEYKAFTDLFLHTYISAYYLDLKNFSQRVYLRSSELADKYSRYENYLESITKYINEDVHPDDRDVMLSLVQPDYIRDQLTKTNDFMHVFRDISGGVEKYYRMHVIRGQDEDHCALGFTNVDAEIRAEQQNTAIIRTLSDEYLLVFTVNLPSETSRIFKVGPDFAALFSQLGIGLTREEKFTKRFRAVAKVALSADDYAPIVKLASIPVIRKTLKSEQQLVINFRTPIFTGKNEHYILRIVALDSEINDVVFGVKSVESEYKSIEREEQASQIIENLTMDYQLVLTANLKTGEASTVLMTGSVAKAIRSLDKDRADSRTLPSRLAFMAANVVHPDDCESFIESLSLKNLSKELHTKKVYIHNFRTVRKDGSIHFFQAKVVKSNNMIDQVTIGIKNTDSEVQAENLATEAREIQISLLDGLGREYHSIWLINGKTGATRPIRIRPQDAPEINSHTGKEYYYPVVMKGFISKYVMIEDRDKMNKLTSPENLQQMIPDEGIYSISFRGRNEDGSPDYQQVSFAKALNSQGQRSYVMAFRDQNVEMKEEIRKQELLKDALLKVESANKAKSSFLFNMSHDIRTPMNAIKGFTELALRNINDKALVVDSLKKASVSSDHLLELINNVLDLARIESGKSELAPEPTNIHAEGENVENIISNLLHEKGINYKHTHSPSIKNPWIYADRLRIRQILLNILNNASKFTAPGGLVTHSVEEIESKDPEYTVFKFTITDTGIGMSEEFASHIFDEFSREKTATESGIQGTGLGMSIVKRLIDMMHGTIEVKSSPGKGTTVVFYIPFKIYKGPESISHSVKNLAPREYDFTGKRVLLAEDNEINREIACAILKEKGMIVDEAKNGRLAVEFVKANSENYYDYILMDIQMPIMNGYDATVEIRKLPFRKHIPIIALSANAFEEDVQKSLASGMDAHIAKPIDIDELYEVLDKFSNK